MRPTRPAAAEQDDLRSVIAAFDDWGNLDAALTEMNADESCSYCAVLHARGEASSEACGAVHEIASLQHTHSRTCVIRSEGFLSRALADALRHGTHTLADALRQWVSADQARHLEDHIAQGRLLLWVQPLTPEQFGRICGHLVRASRHMVEICKAESHPQPKRARQ